MPRAAVSLAAILVLGLCLGGLALTQVAQAQIYPEALGAVSGSVSCTTPGSTTNVIANTVDSAGEPVPGEEITFRIAFQPGNDAAWANGSLETTATTDANGNATAVLSSGSVLGSIMIELIGSLGVGQVEQVVSETCDPGAVQPPAEVLGAEGLPATGSSPADGSLGLPTWQIAVLAIGVAALASGFVIIVRRNSRA